MKWLAMLGVCSIVFCRGDMNVLAGEDVSWFRHDHGVAGSEQPLPDNFSDDARLVWKSALAPGNSTPCVTGDSVFLTTWLEAEKQLSTVALSRSTGELRWKKIVPTEQLEAFHPVGSPASSTPACNGHQVFSFFGSYGLLCYDMDGNLLWEKRMGPFQDEFGASSSPALADGKVILCEDHDIDSFLIALDQKTGETLWKIPREEASRSYSTPVVFEHDGSRQILVAGSLQLSAYDPTTGAKLWWYDGLSRIVDSTPVISDGTIYIATWTPGGDAGERISMEPFEEALTKFDQNKDGAIGQDELPADSEVLPRFFRMDLNQDQKLEKSEWARHAAIFERAQNVAIAIQPGGTGKLSSRNVRWTYDRGLPTVPSSVAYQGILYMVKDSGIVTSLDLSTGEMLHQGRAQGRGNYYASIVAGDGKVFLTSESGVMTVLKAEREWTTLSSHAFGERIMATPVVSDGFMFIRTDAALYCYTKK
jgi:outer membrane protein assembly factor BamB